MITSVVKKANNMETISDCPPNVLSSSATTLIPCCRSRQSWNLDEVNFVRILINGMLMGTAKESKLFRISNLEKFNTYG